MSVTEEVSHPDRSPSKEVAPLNMPAVLATPDRSGAGEPVTLYIMLPAPWNASAMVVHDALPHCVMLRSCWAFAAVSPPRCIRVKSPEMRTV